MQIHYLRRIVLGSPLLLAAIVCNAAHAFQRVTLRNGFSYDCARYEPLDASHIRLFLTIQAPDTQASDFIDLTRQSIATIETLPDPPPPPPTTVAAVGVPTANVPELLNQAGAQHHIDADLLASVVRAESGGRTNAISRTGARGLMQLMPGTANQLGVADSFQPEQNVRGGTAYLDALLTRYHDNMALALAAYNAGPLAVYRYHGIPPYRETQAYVARVIHEFNRRVLAREALAKRAVATALPSPAQPSR